MTRLVFNATVAKVEERKRVTRSRKDAQGDSHFDEESTGWWVVLGDVGFYAGTEKPEFEAGNLVKVIIEKE